MYYELTKNFLIMFQFNDGGRSAAGYKGKAGDCVCRAIAIVSGKSYQEVYDRLFYGIKELAKGRSRAAKRAARGEGKNGTTPRNGVNKKVYHEYITKELGMKWIPTMGIGTGCKIHLVENELPKGRIICRLSRHLTAVIDGVINDTFNPQRGGGSWMKVENGIESRGTTSERCVYGYYAYPE